MRLPSGVMDKQRHIQDLADELLDNILSFLLGPVNEVAGPDAHSSSADFARRSGEHSDLDRFRLVCRKFMRISTPIKFRHFALRFSRDGFAKLEGLLDWQLACHVRSFTYMVRPFYQGTGTRSNHPYLPGSS